MHPSIGFLHDIWLLKRRASHIDSVSDSPPDSKVHGANMGPTGGRQDPCGPHVGHVDLAVWDSVQRSNGDATKNRLYTYNDAKWNKLMGNFIHKSYVMQSFTQVPPSTVG